MEQDFLYKELLLRLILPIKGRNKWGVDVGRVFRKVVSPKARKWKLRTLRRRRLVSLEQNDQVRRGERDHRESQDLEIEQWLSSYNHWLLIQKTRVSFSAPTWQITTICNTSSRKSKPSSGFHECQACKGYTYTYMQPKH